VKEVTIQTWTEWLADRLRATKSPYADLYHGSLETQIQPTTDDDDLNRYTNWHIVGTPRPVRTPANGKTSPVSNDGPVDFNPLLIAAAGTSWWNWRDGVTEACFFDFDYGHGPSGLDEAGIAKVDQWATRLPYVMNCESKSGKGRHWLVRLAKPLPAKVRGEHSRNCQAVKERVSKDLGFDIGDYVCSFGGIQYIFAAQKKGSIDDWLQQDSVSDGELGSCGTGVGAAGEAGEGGTGVEA
jgi:hypothetical protein